jgi:translocator protein
VDSYTSYQTLIRPEWAPPAWVFGPVWTLLYAIIAVTYGTVFYKAFTGALPWKVALPFALNLVFNFSYTYLQFGLKNYTLASVDILLILGTLIWALVVIYPYIKWAALANIPYLLWVSFATVLQLTVTYLNR